MRSAQFAAMATTVLTCWTSFAVAGLPARSEPQDATAKQDKTFLKEAIQESLAEIAFSKMTVEKTKNDEVRRLAQKIVDEDSAMINNLKPAVHKVGLHQERVLTRDHEMQLVELRKHSGDERDRAYLKLMVQNNHQALKGFAAEEQSTHDEAFKQVVAQAEQLVRQHSIIIDEMARKDGVDVPSGPA